VTETKKTSLEVNSVVVVAHVRPMLAAVVEEEEDNRLSDDNPIFAHDSVVVVVKVKGNLAGIGIIQECGAVAMIIHY
jgi:hypothetical protein